LKALGDRVLQADFTEGKEGFHVSGKIQSPWRFTQIVEKDIFQLIWNLNCQNLAETIHAHVGAEKNTKNAA
jgi:hypothetical protein